MRKQVILIVGALVSLAARARADVPAWCGGATFEVDGDHLSRIGQEGDPRDTLVSLAEATCSNSDAAQAHRGEIDGARAAWGKKYGLAEADWAEVIAWDKDRGGYHEPDYSGNTLATLTPVDQYQAIAFGFEKIARDPLYFADALDGQLSETGRLALVAYCLNLDAGAARDDNPVTWAVCQDDIEKLDLAKLFGELHADPHAGYTKFAIRVQAVEIDGARKDHAEAKAKLVKKDSEYGRVFDVAAKARAEWPTTIGTNTALLELVKTMDSAVVFHSRKQLDGCEAKTAAALATAVSVIPAKSFAGMHDDPNAPTDSFAKQARNVFATSPQVTLAGIAYSECRPRSGLGNYLASLLNGVPTARGPRDYALAALMATDFKFDDTSVKGLSFPALGQRPYPYGQVPMSWGGTVHAVKAVKDALDVTMEKTTERVEDCVAEHEGKVVRIRDDGSLEREIDCDRMGTVTRETSAYNLTIASAYQKWLRAGVRLSVTSASNEPMDVIAVWPSKTAKLPSIVLGGSVR